MISIKIGVNDTEAIARQEFIAEIQAAVFFAIIAGVVVLLTAGSIVVVPGITGKTAGKVKGLILS